MKIVAVAGMGGLVSAAAAAGPLALVGLAVLIVLLVGVLCWTVADSVRTANLVAILGALRPPFALRPALPAPARGRRRRRRR